MTSSNSQPEQSMEEILASIRRIISEESDPGEGQPGESSAGPRNPDEPSESEGILDLTRMVRDDGTVVDLPPEGEATQRDVTTEAEVMPEDRQPAEELRPEQAEAPQPEAEAAAEEHPEPDIELEAVKQDTDAAAAIREAVARGLLSEQTAAMSTAALSALAEAVAREQVRVPGRSLDDLVREILRPLLREWLDKNLPDLIERLVRQEIEKMVGRVRDG